MARQTKKIEKTYRKKNVFRVPSVHLHLAPETKRGIAVVVFSVVAGVTALSLFHAAGSLGDALSRFLLVSFGVMGYLLPLLFLLVAFTLLRQDTKSEEAQSMYLRAYLGVLVLAAGIAGLLHIFYISAGASAFSVASEGRGAGYFGALFAAPLFNFLGLWAGSLILFAAVVIGTLVTLNIPLRKLFPEWQKKPPVVIAAPAVPAEVKISSMAQANFVPEKVSTSSAPPPKPVVSETSSPVKSPSENSAPKLDSIVLDDRKDWKLPPFDLLDEGVNTVDSGNIEANVAIIHKTLQDFGIEVEMGEVSVGPTVTQYTLRPTTGVKLSQIAGLQNDLALALAAHSIRMELPIPGRSLVGIEVPNKSSAIVRLREVLQTPDFINHKSRLAIALGRDVTGAPQVGDLSKMPHLLIAGATGTGKSVAINSLFISFLYRNTPQDVKFIVIDPKRVELNLYNGIPHLLTPVIIEPEKAVNSLKWAVAEMERRYKVLSEAHKRNITEYNEVQELRLPYIIIIVDELADLMAVAQSDVEAAIVRLAQMARAVGIHLVLATQRPSVDIITGLIKANITSRIAFAVASQIDSRTIIDSSGAEKLLGNGDMLFISAEFNKPKRVQGAYIGEKEVKKVVDFFKAQTGAVIYNDDVVSKPKRSLGIPGADEGGEDDDELVAAATEEVLRAGKASASFLQRRLKIGYARAARMLDLLEERGIIGPGEGAKPREVYGAIPQEEKAEYGVEEERENF